MKQPLVRAGRYLFGIELTADTVAHLKEKKHIKTDQGVRNYLQRIVDRELKKIL